jgi:hypothetical protein
MAISSVQLVFGANKFDRIVSDADKLLAQYRHDIGFGYHEYVPNTLPTRLVPEDLAVTLLVNSRVGWRAFQSVQQHGHTIPLEQLPPVALEKTTAQERKQIAAMIAQMAQWPGFAASVATKMLHKKRPDLIPILDNQAIFGAYLNPRWPAHKAPQDSVKSSHDIQRALDWIHYDLTRPENRPAWSTLQQVEPSRTLIQLFDSVWWIYFRTLQPVKQSNGI